MNGPFTSSIENELDRMSAVQLYSNEPRVETVRFCGSRFEAFNENIDRVQDLKQNQCILLLRCLRQELNFCRSEKLQDLLRIA